MTLPRGWATGRFEDVVTVVRGVTFSKDQRAEEPTAGYRPCLRSGNVQQQLTIDNLIYVPQSVVKSSDRFIRDGDAIVSMSNSYDLVGKVARADKRHEGMTFGAFLSSFRSELLDSGYLFGLLRSPSVQSDMRATASQTVNISNLSISGMADIVLPIPPAAEQCRIVVKLDALTARLARARAELDRVQKLATKLRQAALSGIRTRVASAPLVRVADVAETTFDGPFGSNLKSADYSTKGVRVIRLENIGHLQFVAEKETYIPPAKYDTLTRHTLQGGDILFSSFVDQQVRVCLLPASAGLAINKADCFAVRIAENRADARFVTLMLASTQTYEAMRAKVHGATRPRIGLSQLRDYELPMPDLATQRSLADLLDAAFARADRLEAEAARARALLDRLESAILARAFRGELVPQDPTDEPATVLLDRIRARRAAAPNARRGRRSA